MLELHITLPMVPPSNNLFIGRENRWEYQSQKKAWAALVRAKCGFIPQNPIPKARVEIFYYFVDNRRRDPDNYSGKFILDGLVRAGIIKDDSFSCVRLALSAAVDKERPRTEITVTEVENV